MTWFHVSYTEGQEVVVESDTVPSMQGLSSRSYGCATREELYQQFGLLDDCSLCHSPVFGTHYTNDVKSVQIARHICFDCWFWTENIKPGKGLVIQGKHYTVGPEHTHRHAFRGMGGRKFLISKSDGTLITTTNLWHQGTVPAHLRHLYPDNAVFLGGAGYVDMGGGYGSFRESEAADGKA